MMPICMLVALQAKKRWVFVCALIGLFPSTFGAAMMFNSFPMSLLLASAAVMSQIIIRMLSDDGSKENPDIVSNTRDENDCAKNSKDLEQLVRGLEKKQSIRQARMDRLSAIEKAAAADSAQESKKTVTRQTLNVCVRCNTALSGSRCKACGFDHINEKVVFLTRIDPRKLQIVIDDN